MYVICIYIYIVADKNKQVGIQKDVHNIYKYIDFLPKDKINKATMLFIIYK